MVQVKTFYAYNELRNFSYLIFDDETAEAWIIDPYDAVPIIDYISKNSLVLRRILNTHSHSDHVRGNRPLQEAFAAQASRLKSSTVLKLSSKYTLETLDTPGHTLDHQVFIWKSAQKPLALFSGDTLFNAGVGNCKNGGDVGLLYQSTMKLMASLPEDTLLYPGHDYLRKNLEFAHQLEPSNLQVNEVLKEVKDTKTEDRAPMTLGKEKLLNPFLRLDSSELRENLNKSVEKIDDELAFKKELFFKIRSLRDKW